MDLKITGIDPKIIKKIDELAKEKKISREEFIKKYVIDDVVENEISDPVVEISNYLKQQNEFLETVEKRADNIITLHKKKNIIH